MIRFLTGVYKKPGKATIYEALQDVRKCARTLPHVAYRHVRREANFVADDMARRALEVGANVAFWNGNVPTDAPANQVKACYDQQHDVAPELPATTEWLPPVAALGALGAELERVEAQ